MYRPPINPGYDDIGAAIAAALGNATTTLRQHRMEDREESRYQTQQARQRRLDEIAEQERRRQQAIQDAELGVVGADEAYEDPIAAAMIDRSNPSAPRPDTRPVVGGQRQGGERRLRQGVTRFGEGYIDPRRSLSFQREALQRESLRSERDAELARNAERLMALDPKMTRAEAVARAAGLSATSPLTRAQQLAQRREELELADVFNARESARSLSNNLALTRERRKDDNATMGRARRQNEAEGYALTAATDAARAKHGNPLGYIRVQLRRQLGSRMTEGEIQELAVRAYQSVQDQGMQEVRFNERNEDDDIGDDSTTPPPNPTRQQAVSPQLTQARQEWDELYQEAQKIQDPLERRQAMRALGRRP